MTSLMSFFKKLEFPLIGLFHDWVTITWKPGLKLYCAYGITILLKSTMTSLMSFGNKPEGFFNRTAP